MKVEDSANLLKENCDEDYGDVKVTFDMYKV